MRLPPRDMPRPNDSSRADEHASSTSDDASTRSSNEGSSSSVNILDSSNSRMRVRASKPSLFRSVLRGGGASGTPALKNRLERLRKFDNTEKNKLSGGVRSGGGGRGLQRFRQRKGGPGGNGGSRPPVQHAESLSSDERSQGSSGGGSNAASGRELMSPASPPGGMTTSKSEDDDEQQDWDRPRRGNNVGGSFAKGKSLFSTRKTNSQASQLKRGLLRFTGRTSRPPPAPRLSASSRSSSTASERQEEREEEEEEGRAEFTSSPGRSVAAADASLLNNIIDKKKQPIGRAPRGGLDRREQDEDSSLGQSTASKPSAGRSGSGGSPGRSSRTGVGLLREQQEWAMPSWRRLVRGLGRWGSLDDPGAHEVAPVTGVGRPTAGMIENAMYGCFGGVAGRPWPGVGLALRPAVGDEDAKQIRVHVKPHTAALEDDVVRVHVIGTDALPEDSRITRPMIVVHIIDSSTGKYLSRRIPPKEMRDTSVEAEVAKKVEPIDTGGATTTFEQRTVWDLATSERPETGLACGIVPPVATQPWVMTMRSSTPIWDEALVFAESYRRLLAPATLVLFELVDFATALSLKEAREGGGLSKIAWAFLKPIGAGGECNVGVRNGDHVPSSSSFSSYKDSGDDKCARRSRLQLYQHQPLSMLCRWQARWRGFPRLFPPAAPHVPDIFLQFLLVRRKRYPATLAVAVGPTLRPRPMYVARRPRASHERERHQLSYEALAAMHQQSRETREKDEAAGILSTRSRGDAGGGSSAKASATTVARTRRLRENNQPCVLPDRLLHRVYAGQNGAMTLAFSGSGSLLAAACCDDPLPGRFPIRLIDSETGRCRHELRGHASMVYSLVWSPGDSFLLSASADGTAKVWCVPALSNAGGGESSGLYVGRGAPASTEGLSASATRGGKGEGPRLACVLQHAPPCFVYAAVFQPAEVADRSRGPTASALDHQAPVTEASECALVVTGAFDRRLRLWDTTAAVALSVGTERRAKMLGALSSKTVHESHVNAIVYDSRNSRLYSGDGAGVIVVWRRGGGGQGGVEDYGILRKVKHADLLGKAITSLALAPRLRRGQLLVQAHGNTLRLLDLGTYQLVNPGFSGGATAESLIRASFSPDGRFVVSGSEKGLVQVWEAQEGKRIKTPLQTLGIACCLRCVAWHPHQHVVALAGYGQDAPVLLYSGDARADKTQGGVQACASSSAMVEQAAREPQASSEEHRRRLDSRQRLRELRIKRLRAKALGQVDGPLATGTGPSRNHPESGVVAALTALTAGGGDDCFRQSTLPRTTKGTCALVTTRRTLN